jgi:hypothetical protein
MYNINAKIAKSKFEDKLVVVLALILVIIIFVLTSLTFNSEISKQSQQETSILSPTPFVSKNLLNYVEKSIVLSKNDNTAKTKLLSLLPSGDVPGIIYQSSDFSVEYISSAKMFLVEIKTINIQSAKAEAEDWFLSQGVSQQGICDYPVDFYLSNDVSTQLNNQRLIFSPLPNGC